MKSPVLKILLISSMVSCAGPHSPFGAVSLLTPFKTPDRSVAYTLDDVAITTNPRFQLYHRTYPLEIIVYDKKGIPNMYEVGMEYNGQFTANIKKKYIKVIDPFTISVTYPDFKLQAMHGNNIKIFYKRHDEINAMATSYYTSPPCGLKDTEKIHHMLDFDVPDYLQDSMQSLAHTFQKNPALLAGLIAQESAFNPYALSSAKAIGLTQITPQAAMQILRKDDDWPKYPNIHELSVLQIKFLMLSKQINQYNEWKLHPMYSLQGGLRYLDYLENYWNNSNNEKILEKEFGTNVPMTDIVLASYNSGPARVKRSIEFHGKNWINGNDLKAAKYYVSKVKSYCHDFSNPLR